MVGVVARCSIDSEHGTSRRLPHGTAGLAHSVARFFDKGIDYQFHLHRSETAGELRQTLKLRAGNRQIPPLGMAHGAKFLLAERFQGRPTRLF
jgi:hypothetical protein